MTGLSMPIIWLIVFAVLIIIEFLTMGLTTIWFACGSIIACLASAFGWPLWLQIIFFVVVSAVLLIFTRPIALKYFNKSRIRTNVEGIVGKQAVVTSEIDNIRATGQVKIDGMDWSARSENGANIATDSIVTIVRVEGVKLIVKEEN